MRITTVLKAAAVGLAVLALTAPSIAQEDSSSHRILNQDPIIADLDFDGGSLESFVKALRKAAGDNPINIVFSPEAASLPVAPIALQQVDTFTALESVSQSMQITPMLGEDRRSIELSIRRIAGNGAPVYSIEVREGRTPRAVVPGRPAAELHTAVHSITELTTGSGAMSADDVLSAIQAALAIESADEETKIRYHEETGLIFARVTSDQGGVIEQTLVGLRLSANALRQQNQIERAQLMERIKQLEEQVQSLMAKNERLNQMVREANETINMLQKQLDESSGRD